MPKRLLQGCMFGLFFMLIKSNGAPTGFFGENPSNNTISSNDLFYGQEILLLKTKNETKQIDDIEFVFSPLRMYVWVCVYACVYVHVFPTRTKSSHIVLVVICITITIATRTTTLAVTIPRDLPPTTNLVI